MSFTLGMLGPINVSDFKDLLHPGEWRDHLPKGQGGTPVNLLCRELIKRGQRLVVFSCDDKVQHEVILQGDNLRLCIGPVGKRPARNFFSLERNYLQRAIQREKPDLLHAQWTYEYAMPAQVSGLPHLITAHDAPINVLRYNFIPYRVARTMMAYRVISRARRIVSVSPYVTEHLRQYMLYRGSQQVIPNGMPDHVFSRTATPRTAEQPLTFASILVGWSGYKNGEVAIEAFARMRSHYPDARLIMFGAGHGPGEDAEQWARARGFEQGIEFAGQQPYASLMQRVANEVDVLVHPALEEAQPMALIEAMALSIPVIGGKNSGGVPWTLGMGEAGILVDMRRPAEAADAMLMLARDSEARRKWGERGRALAEQRFHINAVADAYQRIYAEIMEAM